MPLATCPSCQAQLRINHTGPNIRIRCPGCGHLFAATGPATGQVPLSLDDDPELPDTDGEPTARGGRAPLLVALLGGFVVLAAGGGIAAWVLTGKPDKPTETAEVRPDRPIREANRVDPQTNEPKTADPPAPPKALTGEQVNLRLLKSAVFILSVEKSDGGIAVACGSGSLVHKLRRLVVTNYHVVEEKPRVATFFPAYDPKGELITNPAYYVDNAAKLRVWGKVVARSPRLDLAILELETVPPHVAGLSLAAKPAATGSTVYSIGGSGVNLRDFSGALWRLSTGAVRGRYKDVITFRSRQTVEAMFLETQKPINPGDSGGPTVNDRGELVAVVSASDPRKDLVKLDIDLTEVRSYLAGYARGQGWVWEDAAAAPPVSADDPGLEITPALLVTRATAGPPEARVEAVQQLGAMGAGAKSAVPDLVLLLDDPDERVRRSAAAALVPIGPPARADAGCVGRALAGTGRNGQLYALNYFAGVEKVTRDQLPVVAKFLAHADAAVREAALRAVAFYGPDSKPLAFGQLLTLTLDPDPSVAALASKVLLSFAPFEGKDREVLVANLRHQLWQLRRQAVVILTPSAPDETTALAWFEARLEDETPEVREAALLALTKWGPAVKKIGPAVVKLAGDNNGGVRLAAVRALGRIGNGPGVVDTLAQFLANDSPPAVRDAAIRSLLTIDLTDPKTDLPVLSKLVQVDDPGAQAQALAKLAKFGPEAKGLLPAVSDCLGSTDPAVQYEALKVAAAIGPDAADLAPRAAALVASAPRPGRTPAAPEGGLAGNAVQLQAVETLSRLGPKTTELLVKALDERLPKGVAEKLCDALKARRAGVPKSAIPRLITLADDNPDLRSKVSETLAHMGGDEVARAVAERTSWVYKTLVSGKKIKTSKYPLEMQVWALQTLGKMNPTDFTDKGKVYVDDLLKSHRFYNPDLECRKEAEAALARLLSDGLRPKKP